VHARLAVLKAAGGSDCVGKAMARSVARWLCALGGWSGRARRLRRASRKTEVRLSQIRPIAERAVICG